jgi:branched-chain amino acid transport system permease protein
MLSSFIEFISSEYIVHLAILCCMYLILAQGLNLTFGLGRLFNLAHVASFAIGAYTTALLAVETEAGFFKCILASMLTSGLFAVLLGGISLRLAQDYFAIGTLAFSSVVSSLLINWKSITRGVLGIPGIPRPEVFGFDFQSNSNFLVLIAVFTAVVQAISYILHRGSFGRALMAQAEYEDALLAIGCDAGLIKNLSFLISSAFAGLAGSFFAFYLSYIDPSSFSLGEMIFILTIVVVGRPGSLWGVTWATVFLVLLPEPLRFIDINSAYLGPARQLMQAAILFGVVFINRRVLFPPKREV